MDENLYSHKSDLTFLAYLNYLWIMDLFMTVDMMLYIRISRTFLIDHAVRINKLTRFGSSNDAKLFMAFSSYFPPELPRVRSNIMLKQPFNNICIYCDIFSYSIEYMGS